ncbi:MAG: transposase [Acidimicrobiales bacterium]
MARRTRSAVEADWHHVMNRGARKLPVFGDDADRHRFLHLLADAAAGVGVEIHAYALMGNHYHGLFRSQVSALSAMMQTTGSRYTQSFNAKYGLDGPLFRGRFRSQPILEETYLCTVVRYIHRNPIAGLERFDRAAFDWTSHPAYVGEARVPAWLRTTTLLRLIGGTPDSFRRFVEGPEPVDHLPTPIRSISGPRPLRPADIEAAVGVSSPMEFELVRAGGRGIRDPLRAATLILCRELTDVTADELASRYGYRSGGSVRSAATRAAQRLATDPLLQELVDDARRRLIPSVRRSA